MIKIQDLFFNLVFNFERPCRALTFYTTTKPIKTCDRFLSVQWTPITY